MLTPVSAPPGAAAPASGGAAGSAALQAQLQKCEAQLSDWVHCASAKTPAGKAKIAELEAQRQLIEQRIQARASQSASPVAAPAAVDASRRVSLSSAGVFLDVQA